jgi:hypothetical protein
MLPAKFGFIWPSSFRGEDLHSLAKLNQTWQEASTVFSCIFHAGFFTFFFSQIGGARYTTELIVHIFFLTEFDCLFMGK